MHRFLVSGVGRLEVCTGWEVLWKQGLFELGVYIPQRSSLCHISQLRCVSDDQASVSFILSDQSFCTVYFRLK